MKNKSCFVMILSLCSFGSLVLASSNQNNAHCKKKKQDESKSIEHQQLDESLMDVVKGSLLATHDIQAWIDQCHAHRHPTLLRFHVIRARNQQQEAERARLLRDVGANVD